MEVRGGSRRDGQKGWAGGMGRRDGQKGWAAGRIGGKDEWIGIRMGKGDGQEGWAGGMGRWKG